MNDFSIALLGLLGAIAGTLPGLIGAVRTWLRERDRTAKRRRAVELAKLEVEFISSWMDAASKLTGEEIEARKAMAQERLLLLMSGETQVQPESRDASREVAKVKGKTAFLMYLGFYCFMIFGASIDDSDNVSITHLVSEIQGDGLVAMTILAIPLVLLLIRWRRSLRQARAMQESA